MRRIPDSLNAFIDGNSFFYVFGHVSPDGDCVGSCLAFAGFLKKLGKDCMIVAESKKDFYQYKSKVDLCAGGSAYDVEVVGQFDFDSVASGKAKCVFLDCSGIERTGDIYLPFKDDTESLDVIRINSIRIDHHPQDGCAVASSYVDPDASSASELVGEVIESRIGFVDKYMCCALFFGIASDTGFFRFSTGANGSGTFQMCSRLVCAGVAPNVVGAVIDSGKDRDYVDYYTSLARNAEYLCGGKAVVVFDDVELYRKHTKAKRPSDDLYRLFLKISGVEAVVFVKCSEKEGYVDASVRVAAFSSFDANSFCMRFGGGGHVKAAGFHVSGVFDDVCGMVRRELSRCF